MNQLTMLVTADGNWVLPDSEEFLAALGDPAPDYDAVGFAVRNLGFVKFQVLDRLVTEIELHPRNVDLRALLAVERQLGEVATNLFRIKYLDGAWKSEISASLDHTLARLHELCAPAFEPPPSQRFTVEPQDPRLLDGVIGREQPLGRMAMKWRASFGKFDLDVMGIAERHDLLPLFAIAGLEKAGDRPVWRFLGGAHRWAGDSYRVHGLHHPIDAMPDKEYGTWVSQFYRAVAETSRPRYDVVTAEMEYHAEAGKPRRVVRYERLMLPWRTPTGERLVTACTRLVKPPAENLPAAGSDNSASTKKPKSS
ncbi:MAG: hypothetical protein JO258_00545 [Alphaproteobacteria bacterium]|nr:hypothetical protein [Alphaproteobacteria bacterium]